MAKIPWWFTEIGDSEKESVLSAFARRRFTQGPVTEEFEETFARMLGVPYAVATTSGTAAITLSLMVSGVGPGDEVIVPALTWIATGNAAAILGAKVVLVDCLPDSPLIDPDGVKRSISERTKAIIPVHLNGRACQTKDLLEIAAGVGAVVIEDTCKAMMSRRDGVLLGTQGRMGCFSLGMISLVSTGYGGVVVTREKRIYDDLKFAQNQGVPRKSEEKYYGLGHNLKMSDLLAAIGVAQIKRVAEKRDHIQEIYRRYMEGLAGVSYLHMIEVCTEQGEIPLCAEVQSAHREEIVGYLDRHGVESLRFHLPLHRAPHFRSKASYPNSSKLADKGFILPSGPSQPLQNVDRCIELLQAWKPGK